MGTGQKNQTRFQVWLTVVILFAVSGSGCAPSIEEQVSDRLERFRATLPDQIRGSFDNQEYQHVIVMIDSLLATDDNFESQWLELKKEEAIELFSTSEVIDYYDTYFVRYSQRR
jgi:hypothetical protein